MLYEHDDDFLDSVAVLALGALPEAEARRVAEHMPSCDLCRALFTELRPAANLVGYAEEAVALDEVTSARMKARLMRAVSGDVGDVAGAGAGNQRLPKRASAFGWLAAVAAAVLAIAIGADDLAVRDRAEHASASDRTALVDLQTRVAAAQRESGVSESRLVALLGPGGRHYAVPQGEVVTNAGRIFVALKLAALPQGKVYQAWTLARGAKAVAPSVTFSPASNGVAFVELPVDAAGLAAVAVSVEPTGGSHAPTSTPKFIRKLS